MVYESLTCCFFVVLVASWICDLSPRHGNLWDGLRPDLAVDLRASHRSSKTKDPHRFSYPHCRLRHQSCTCCRFTRVL